MTEGVHTSLRKTERPQSRIQTVIQNIGFEEWIIAPGMEDKPIGILLRIFPQRFLQRL
jgi:hypothetical protein